MISQVKPETCADRAGRGSPPGTSVAAPTKDSRSERYAIVVVLEADSPDAAWEAVRGTLGHPARDAEPDCIYIGAPWQGIPAEAEDLSTDHLELAMFVPNGRGFVPITAVLRACG